MGKEYVDNRLTADENTSCVQLTAGLYFRDECAIGRRVRISHGSQRSTDYQHHNYEAEANVGRGVHR